MGDNNEREKTQGGEADTSNQNSCQNRESNNSFSEELLERVDALIEGNTSRETNVESRLNTNYLQEATNQDVAESATATTFSNFSSNTNAKELPRSLIFEPDIQETYYQDHQVTNTRNIFSYTDPPPILLQLDDNNTKTVNTVVESPETTAIVNNDFDRKDNVPVNNDVKETNIEANVDTAETDESDQEYDFLIQRREIVLDEVPVPTLQQNQIIVAADVHTYKERLLIKQEQCKTVQNTGEQQLGNATTSGRPRSKKDTKKMSSSANDDLDAILVETNQPSTSQGVQHDSLTSKEQITNSITVYNRENALCTILTNGKETEELVKNTQNNSVVLVFTNLLNRLSSGNVNRETEASTSTAKETVETPMLPKYSTIQNNYQVTVNSVVDKQNANTALRINANQQNVVIPGPPLYGAPPSYSAVLRLEPPNRIRQPVRNQPSPPFVAPPPPPSYAEVQGNYSTREVMATFDEYIWGPEPLLIYCPRCATIVQTTTQYHRSTLTHFSALALCLCGCWPCCLLPYCMKSCKNTYHNCPHCQTFLGMYSPW